MQTPRWRPAALLALNAALLVGLLGAWAWAQPAASAGEQQLINIDVKDAPIDQVLRMLAKAANVNIICAQDVKGTVQSITLRDVTVEAALRLIAKSHGFNWWKEDNIYVVSKEPPPAGVVSGATASPGAAGSGEQATSGPTGGTALGGSVGGETSGSGPLTSVGPRTSAVTASAPPPLVSPAASGSAGSGRAEEPGLKTTLIPLSFADAGEIALMFGGSVCGGGPATSLFRPIGRRGAQSLARGSRGLNGPDVFQGGFGAPTGGDGSSGWGQRGGGSSGGSRGGSSGGSSRGGSSSNTGSSSSGSSRFGGGSSSQGGTTGGAGALGNLLPGDMEPPIAFLPENALLVQGVQADIDKLQEILLLLDKPTKQVELSVKFIEVTTDAQEALGIEWSVSNGSLEFFNRGLLPGTATSQVKFSRGRFDAVLGALLSSGRATVVNEPHVLAQNNQYAHIEFTTTIPFFSAQISYNQFGQRTVDFTNDSVDVTNSLDIVPRINADDSVSVFLSPELDDVAGQVQGPNGEVIPIVTYQYVETTIRVQDGETVVLGGVIRKQEGSTLVETPLLSRIPIIGKLFTKRETIKNNRELLIFVTPRIVRDVPQQ